MAPNLIVVVFDTLRYDAVQTDLARTPNLDRFASESAVFTNAWAEALPTIPFRRALYTGMRSYPWRHSLPDRGSFPHMLGWHAIPESQQTAAEYLSMRGYVTQLVSDLWHQFKPTMNFSRGFAGWDFIRGQEGDTHALSAASLGEGDAIDPTRIGPASYLHQVRGRRCDDDYFAAQVLDRAARFVEGIQGAGPYCLWVESFSPHEFWDPPMRFADEYSGGPAERNHIVPQALNPKKDQPAAEQRDIDRTVALYQGYCTFCDERFGRFMERLERSGALADSVVVVLSDHGTELWDKGQFGKSANRMHPYTTQINMMIRHPEGIGAGRRVDAFAQNQDVLPTLLGLLGVPHPALEGFDLWPLVTGDGAPRRDHVITGYDRFCSVRDPYWNLIIDTLDPARELRLFNLGEDPREERNVAAENPEVVTVQVARLEELLGAPLPATYRHRPIWGGDASPFLVRRLRERKLGPGESWQGSNQV